MRLNLGCGFRKREGWINVDNSQQVEPDQLVDLERLPWPWADDSVHAMLASHSLEHLGQDRDVFLGVMCEAYRVLAPGAEWTIIFPDVHSDSWWGDPTHVRPLTTHCLALFSRRANRTMIERGGSNAWALRLGIDFDVVSAEAGILPRWEHLRSTPAQLQRAIESYNNVVDQWTVTLRALKPPS